MDDGVARRLVQGWRSRMEEAGAELRRQVWAAPARTTYLVGKCAYSCDDLAGHERWHHRVFGPERAAAREALAEQRRARRRLAFAERTLEQRAADNLIKLEWHRRQSAEWHKDVAAKRRARRAADPEKYRVRDRAYYARARERILENSRARYEAAPEPGRARSAKYLAERRDEINARRRATYARKIADKRRVAQAWRDARGKQRQAAQAPTQ